MTDNEVRLPVLCVECRERLSCGPYPLCEYCWCEEFGEDYNRLRFEDREPCSCEQCDDGENE